MHTSIRPAGRRLGLAALASLVLSSSAIAQENVLNLYTARHYQTDEALYTGFTKRTGIRVNRIEGGEDALFERIKNEGAHSPADVFITVDIGRIWRADQAGIFEAVKSPLLESRIPAAYRDPDNRWFGFSARARVIVYDKSRVKPGAIRTYEDLADPQWKDKLCVRSSAHPYMLSLTASMIAHLGEQKAEAWVKGLKANLARDPKGGDTDQIRAAASGECAIAVTNQYYFVRLMRSPKPDDKRVVERLAVVFPNQQDRGTHMNISGGGMLRHAPHKDAARRFLEYLASDEAQAYFANGNNEWPVVAGVKLDNPELESLGKFKTDAINVAILGKNQALAQRISDRVGYK
ncbi:MAG: Fe(3+) ABC transporter substrate-binding protein [Burkholderiales bacterium]|nr:Fe(3+) ABC transporter substrate-binding protein [Burkholderiales bacterium]